MNIKKVVFLAFDRDSWKILSAVQDKIRIPERPCNILDYIGSAYGNIVWKYVPLLHVLNKNENIINAVFWVLSENRKD